MRTDGLLERDRERAELRSVVDAVCRRDGAAALVSGPAGIGKTGLLAEAVLLAVQSGAGVLRARGGAMERDFPYGVVRQLLEREVGRVRSDDLQGAARLAAPALGLPGAGGDEPQEPSEREFAICHGLYWLVSDLAETRPRLLIVDDLQDVDPPSLRFLLYLVRRVQGMALGLVATLRDGAAASDAATLSQLDSDPAVRVIRPGALSPAAVAELVHDRLGAAPHDAFVVACLEVTGGNPFLVGQLLDAAAAERAPATAAGSERVRELVPDAVKRSILSRLDREPVEVRAVARAVAVLGDEVELHSAASLAAVDVAVAADAADRLAQMSLLRDGTPLSFRHPLLRSTILASLAPGERTRAHRRSAEVLQAQGAPAAIVAAHLTELEPAGDERVVAVLREAAGAALRQGAADIATRNLRRALREPPAEERGGVLAELGYALSLAGQAAEAAAALDESVALATDPRERLVRELRAFRAHFQVDGRLDPQDILGMIERLDALGDAPDPLTLTLAGDVFGAATNLPDLLPRLGSLLDGYATARGDAVTERMRLAALSRVACQRGDSADQAAEFAERAIAGRLADETIDSVSWFIALFTLIDADRDETVDRHLAAAMELSRRHGSILSYASASAYEALVAYQRGDVARAQATAVTALDTGSVHGALVPVLVGCLVRARLAAGDVDGAAEAIAPLGDIDIPELAVFNHVLVARAQVRFAQGRIEAALDDVRLSLVRLPRAVRYSRVLPWRQYAVPVLLAAGRHDEALAVAADDVAAADSWGTPAAVGAALVTQAACVGAWERIPMLERAIGILEHSPARLDLAAARLLLGESVTELGSPLDALEPLKAGLALAEQCGAGALVARARQALAATGVRTQETASHASASQSLTPAELRVIDLAAAGLSRRDIAEALFVTERAVEDDLDKLRGKGIAVRTEEAAAAATLLDDPESLPLAQALPSYEIGGELGRGASGVVWAARHRRLGRRVAIKQLAPEFGATSHVRARFLAEARVLASLDHPNIVCVNDFVEVDGVCLLIMERLDGGTAKTRLNEGSLTGPAACAIVLAASLGLEYAHGKGVLHRDVKPQNLLLSDAGLVKVADFGIAKVLGPSAGGLVTGTGHVLGTPAYMAPEQAAAGEISAAVDVHAAGVVLYELLSGKLPYPTRGSPLADIAQLLSNEPIPLRACCPDAPPAVTAIADRALRRDPAQRFPTAAALADALSAAAENEWGRDWLSEATEILRAPDARVRV